MKKLRIKARGERGHSRCRVFSLNFEANMKSSGIKCYVPVEDYRLLENKYYKLFKRYRREASGTRKEKNI